MANALTPFNPTQHNSPFSLNQGVLTVAGTKWSDQIRIQEFTNGFLRMTLSWGSHSRTADIHKNHVNRLSLHGHNGNDSIANFSSTISYIRGGQGNDSIQGGWNRDVILGGSGNDVIKAGSGNDRVWGGSGLDKLHGNAGHDELQGGTHNDVIYGDAGNDRLFGDDGNDWISGWSGNDQIVGGNGNDRLLGRTGNDYVWGGAGNDVLVGADGHDRLYGQSGHDTLWGGNHNDRLIGSAGNDRLLGQWGHDYISAGSGADAIIGTTGNDTIYGGTGADRLLRTDGATLRDQRSWDAVINFRHGGQVSSNVNGNLVTFSAGKFTYNEMIQIDDAFARVQTYSGSTRLLKRSDGGVLTFVRHGRPLSGGSNLGGWNSGGQSIHLVDGSFSSYNWLQQVTIHELGHNWDQHHENSSIWQFRNLSGWQYVNNRWDYQPGKVNFVRAYGRTNYLEDFATSFAAYFMGRSGLQFAGTAVNSNGVGWNAALTKMSYIHSFVRS